MSTKKAEDLRNQFGSRMTAAAAQRPVAAPPEPPAIDPKSAGVSRLVGAATIPLDRIIPDPDQPREEFEPEALDRLATSIRARGVLQPIRVRWDQGRGAYVIVAGERRWRAAGLAGLASIPCVVHDGELSPAELLALQVTENALREDLKPVERAKAYRALMELNGWSGNQLSKELGIAQSSVVDALKLTELAGPVQGMVDRDELAPSAAAKLADLPDDAQVELAREIAGNGLNRAEATEAIRARAKAAAGPRKGRGAKQAPRRTSATIRTASGFKITIEHRKGLDDARIRAGLAEALAQLDREGQADGRAEAAA
jgi:ParB family chromosome partitioning protein